MLKTTLNAPWIEYYKKINAMFFFDPDVSVVYDQDECKIFVYVENQAKADALNLLLKPEKTFGAITLLVDVVPANGCLKRNEDLYMAAFKDNPAVYNIVIHEGAFNATYVIFNKEVVQYFDDDLSSVYGVRSTLYEDIAKDIFNEAPGVYFCTDAERYPFKG